MYRSNKDSLSLESNRRELIFSYRCHNRSENQFNSQGNHPANNPVTNTSTSTVGIRKLKF